MAHGGTELLRDPVAQELLQSTIPARLAYNWTDGTPRVVPIWFHWNGQEVVFGTPGNSPKTQAISTGDPVAVTIDTNEFPNKVLVMRGPATAEMVNGVVEEYAMAAERYFGPEQGQAWVGQLPSDVVMMRIAVRPEHVTVLDFETRFPSALSG